MVLPELYILRHGETEWNRAHRWQGHLDSPLTELGQAQARAVGSLLTGLGVSHQTHRIISSPQGRAFQTARLAFSGAGIETDDALREIGVGAFAGKTRAEIEALAGLPADAPFLDLYAAAPGGETFEALFARLAVFLKRLNAPAVLVTHGITSRFLRTAAMGWGLDRVMDLPGGQGVVHRISAGRHDTLVPEGLS